MNNLVSKESMTSLELLEQINLFRKEEGKKKDLRHKDLLSIIRNEFEEEITGRKISLSEYKDKTGRKLPMFILTLSQAKQVLVRESKYVRRAVIQYIEKLETSLANTQQTLPMKIDVIDFREEEFVKGMREVKGILNSLKSQLLLDRLKLDNRLKQLEATGLTDKMKAYEAKGEFYVTQEL
ncbi:hypothetical protein FSBG_00156 [Fusobacterium gonidiaformans 3-1-5R]|uniref:Uncharacterized protein n=1 Tax=Fusobacterium gonidiaformans 3-1-5R TaxID=469605 RepID=E5BEX8_9FUSO|nr:hypothetical protein [Fusobacterium gonidiaformans]EFS20659.1 hypothetical protein FSBG_00156 [Fusobacterium gonidiaformans 3-1-5R]